MIKDSYYIKIKNKGKIIIQFEYNSWLHGFNHVFDIIYREL